MHYKLLINVCNAIFLLSPNVKTLGISSKLDFGEADTAKTVTTREAYVSVKPSANSDFEKIGVVCTSGGCNKTNNGETDDKKNTITADVLVQVKTKINFEEKSKNKSVDDVPDVPVVVGYAGITDKPSESEITVEQGRSINSNPIVTSSFIPTFTEIDQQIAGEHVYIPSLSSTIDVGPKVHIIKPPVNISSKEDERTVKNVKHKESEIKLQIPYFESSYNNHYFSENVPTQVVWYPKNTVNYNPVEFKTNKRTWNAQQWSGKTQQPTYHKHPNSPQYVKCTCENQNSGLQWYPMNRSRQLYQQQNQHQGVQIDDKLAPLN